MSTPKQSFSWELVKNKTSHRGIFGSDLKRTRNPSIPSYVGMLPCHSRDACGSVPATFLGLTQQSPERMRTLPFACSRLECRQMIHRSTSRTTYAPLRANHCTSADPRDLTHFIYTWHTQVLQRAMKAHQGVIKEFSVDDKGTVMVGALGLPPITGSNPSARACLTALKIVQGMQVIAGTGASQRCAILLCAAFVALPVRWTAWHYRCVMSRIMAKCRCPSLSRYPWLYGCRTLGFAHAPFACACRVLCVACTIADPT